MGTQRAVGTAIRPGGDRIGWGRGEPAAMLSRRELALGERLLASVGISSAGRDQFWRGRPVTDAGDRRGIAGLMEELEPLVDLHDRRGADRITYRGMELSRTLLEVGGVAAEAFHRQPGLQPRALRR